MKKAILLPAGLLVAGGLGYLRAKNWVQRLQQNPDPYPFERLSQEPSGQEILIERLDGTSIRAVSAGSAGPTVVLAHGYGVSLQEWNVIWDRLLAAGYRVIAFDLRGHGRSTIGRDGISSQAMAADYAAVLEHFDVRDAVLVGHSTGVFLAIVFMLTYPEMVAKRLKGCVLAGGTAGQVAKDSPQNLLQLPLIRSGLMQKLLASETYRWWFGTTVLGDAPSPAGILAFNELFAAQRHDQLLPLLDALVREDYYGRLGEISVPCVVICGTKDKTTTAWHSQEMGRRISQARNIWLEGKGHLLNWEAPEVIVEAIQSFS